MKGAHVHNQALIHALFFPGSLIGRCHVLTAGHCALHPTEFQISTELRFTPAQNGKQTDAPFGTFDFIDVKIARRWAIFSDPAHDIALIHIKGIGDLVDKRLGWATILCTIVQNGLQFFIHDTTTDLLYLFIFQIDSSNNNLVFGL